MPLIFGLLLALAALTTPGKASTPTSPRDAAWAASLTAGDVVTLPAGNYRGPWKIGTGVHLIALPGAVLEGGDPVLTINGNAVMVEGLHIRAAPESIGIATIDASGLLLRDVSVSGGMRGATFRRGSVVWQGGVVERSSKYGIWILNARVTLSGLQLSHNQGPALYVGHGNVILSQLDVSFAEYGILAFGAQLEMSRCRFSKIRRAGAGTILSSGLISKSEFEGPFGEAGLSISGARPIQLRGNHIRKSGSMGLKLINAVAELEGNEFSGARSDKNGLEGDGVYSTDSQLESKSDRLLDNGGASVSIMGGKAVFEDCVIQGAGQAAASVVEKGELTLSRCEISLGSTDLVVAPGATLNHDDAGDSQP